MEYDTVEDDLANKNTEDFIRRMYRNNVSQYLDNKDDIWKWNLLINKKFTI